MLRFVGVICIFMFAFYTSFSYERYQKARLLMGEEMLLLLKFFLDELRGLARSPADCICGFKASALEKTSLIGALADGALPSEAYRDAKGSLCLPRGMEGILDGAFLNFGRGGRAEESRRLSEAVAGAEMLIAKERMEHTRRLTLCRTLSAASAIGLVILLM